MHVFVLCVLLVVGAVHAQQSVPSGSPRSWRAARHAEARVSVPVASGEGKASSESAPVDSSGDSWHANPSYALPGAGSHPPPAREPRLATPSSESNSKNSSIAVWIWSHAACVLLGFALGRRSQQSASYGVHTKADEHSSHTEESAAGQASVPQGVPKLAPRLTGNTAQAVDLDQPGLTLSTTPQPAEPHMEAIECKQHIQAEATSSAALSEAGTQVQPPAEDAQRSASLPSGTVTLDQCSSCPTGDAALCSAHTPRHDSDSHNPGQVYEHPSSDSLAETASPSSLSCSVTGSSSHSASANPSTRQSITGSTDAANSNQTAVAPLQQPCSAHTQLQTVHHPPPPPPALHLELKVSPEVLEAWGRYFELKIRPALSEASHWFQRGVLALQGLQHQVAGVQHTLHGIKQSVDRVRRVADTWMDQQQMAETRILIGRCAQLGQVLMCAVLLYNTAVRGRLRAALVHCSPHAPPAASSSSWLSAAAAWLPGTHYTLIGRWFITLPRTLWCVVCHLGMLKLGVMALQLLAPAAWALTGRQLHKTWWVDVPVALGMAGGVLGSVTVHWLGGSWVVWVLLWWTWCCATGLLCNGHLINRPWLWRLALVVVAVALPVLTGWAPFWPENIPLHRAVTKSVMKCLQPFIPEAVVQLLA